MWLTISIPAHLFLYPHELGGARLPQPHPPSFRMSLIAQSLSAASKGDTVTLSNLKGQINLHNCYDKFGATPVHYAARTGKIDCLKWLVEVAGLKANKSADNGATPVHDAAATGQLECLRWLVGYGGCSETERDACGATPLHLAARFGHLNVVAWLVDIKQCSALDRAQNGVTPVHLAAAKGSINCLKWLSQTHPSSVNERANNGTTPTYFAAQEGKLECLQFLVTEANANIQLKANDGMVPIHAAAQMGHLDCLSWMIKNSGVSPSERDNDGATPMHFAAARGHTHILQWLLGRDSSAFTDDLGGTPLHDAAEHGQLKALKVLVASGMDTNIRDFDGLTPADLANECGHVECANFLRSSSQIRKVKSNAKEYLTLDSASLQKTGSGKLENASLEEKKQTHSFKESHTTTVAELSDDEKVESRTKKANLLSEVRKFEPVALKNVLQKKKNLQHMKFGHIAQRESDERVISVGPRMKNKCQDEHQSDIPIWKVALMKKRAEEKINEHTQSTSVPLARGGEKKKSEIPAWKQALIEKKEAERRKHTTTQS